MVIWKMLAVVCAAGALGGMINALISDNGFVKPHKHRIEGVKIYRPGFIGNVFTGAVAAGISWGLYGPLGSYVIVGASPPPPDPTSGVTIAALVGAVLVGVGGARWLTNEVDKSLLKTAATIASVAPSAPQAASRMTQASPAEAVEIAKEIAATR